MSGPYLTFAEIRAVMPTVLDWNEAALMKLGRQSRSPLKFVRVSNRKSQPLWRRSDLLRWFSHTYRNAPELVAEFESKLAAKKVKP